MLIGLALGVIVAFVAVAALRFFRMEDAVEHARSAETERKRVVFEGVLTPREARDVLPDALLQTFAGDRVRITVERRPAAPPEPGPPPSP